MLTVSHLSKHYGSRKVVDDVSFTIGSGEVFCLLGSNGAGKSTTLKILLGLVAPSSGNAELDGNSLLDARSAAKDAILYVPENVNLYDDLNAQENIQYLSAISGLSLNADMIESALLNAGLAAEHHHKRLGQYSKGMRQKVIIAFALLKNARLLLLDEPTSGLDPIAIRDFIAVIQTLKQNGCAVLMVTHDLQCAHLLADRVGVMHLGMLKTVMPTADIQLSEIEKIYFGQAGTSNNE